MVQADAAVAQLPAARQGRVKGVDVDEFGFVVGSAKRVSRPCNRTLQRATEGRDLMTRTEIEREIAVLPGE